MIVNNKLTILWGSCLSEYSINTLCVMTRERAPGSHPLSSEEGTTQRSERRVPESQGHNLVVTVLYVPNSLDSGTCTFDGQIAPPAQRSRSHPRTKNRNPKSETRNHAPGSHPLSRDWSSPPREFRKESWLGPTAMTQIWTRYVQMDLSLKAPVAARW